MMNRTETETHAPLIPIILSGGAGTRLWPVSRRAHPKPFMQLADGQSLAEKTWIRAMALAGHAPILTVTSRDYYFYTRDLYGKLQENDRQALFLLEPLGRNTAPAIGLAAHYVRDNLGDEACLMIMPADHLVRDQRNFEAAVHEARTLAEQGMLVTFGIHPTHAETGYGYIQAIMTHENQESYKVRAFAEKPTFGTAKRFIKSGDFFWNSGMFVWKASAILREIEENIPEIFEPLAKLSGHFNSKSFAGKLKKAFSAIRATSIDYAVMEASQNVHMVKGEFEWNDLGSWEALYSISRKDKRGNVIDGDVFTMDTSNTLIKSSGKFVATIGLENMIVVATDDVLLVAPRDRAQEIKDMVDSLKKGSFKKFL